MLCVKICFLMQAPSRFLRIVQGLIPKLSVTVVPIVYDVIPGEGINSQPQLPNQPPPPKAVAHEKNSRIIELQQYSTLASLC
mmetsp:Transcript_7335/g.11288  ORF Transcript_7335/g.11288 Transcript_7335/m.11288 type:complete len:82 (+) Transcript_7335:355-600(+)